MDKRVKNTKRVLRQSLFELLKNTPLNKITVTRLCGEAGINRATFYLHYKDIYDLMDKIELEYVEELKSSVSFADENGTTFIKLVLFVKRHSDFYGVVFANNIPTKFLDDFFRQTGEMYFAARQCGGTVTSELKYTYDFINYGMTGVFKEWIAGGLKESEKEIAEILDKLYGNLNSR